MAMGIGYKCKDTAKGNPAFNPLQILTSITSTTEIQNN